MKNRRLAKMLNRSEANSGGGRERERKRFGSPVTYRGRRVFWGAEENGPRVSRLWISFRTFEPRINTVSRKRRVKITRKSWVGERKRERENRRYGNPRNEIGTRNNCIWNAAARIGREKCYRFVSFFFFLFFLISSLFEGIFLGGGGGVYIIK